MKKLTLALATLLCATFTFTSCSEEDAAAVLPEIQLAGAWQCTSIGGQVGGVDLSTFGLSTDNTEYGKYTKLFSIVFVPVVNTYYRVGTGDLSSLTSSVAGLTGTLSNGDENKDAAWKSFLSTGTFSVNGSTLILTPKEGTPEEYTYITDGKKLTITERKDVTGGNATVSTITTVVNSILAISGNQTIETTVGVEYSYEKLEIADLINLFK